MAANQKFRTGSNAVVMTALSDRPLRADAARNAERILRAARDVYDEMGPEAPIEAIARRAAGRVADPRHLDPAV